MDISNVYLCPKLLWTDGKFHENLKLKCDIDGLIEWIGSEVPPNAELLHLHNQAILPGMVNSHSHAFHSALRYMNETGGDFWAWRQNMYKLVETMTPDMFHDICHKTFREMLESGITTVGEFHYFHHSFAHETGGDKNGPDVKKAKSEPPKLFNLDKVILQAAKEVGIRIVLLETFYERGGFRDEPVTDSQKRFSASFEELEHQISALRGLLNKKTQHLGLAAHSMRAVGTKNIKALYNLAKEKKLPFHIHLEEQPKEIVDCEEANRLEPSSILLKELEIDSSFTAVHATHTSTENMEQLSKQGANFSICPLTEGCLGNGIPNWPIGSEFACSLGTDCNKRICMAEEMRWLAYLQQVKTNKRGLPTSDAIPEHLFRIATQNGARSLGLPECGELKVGNYCDFFTLDLSKKVFDAEKIDSILSTFIFACSSKEVVNSVAVAGQLHKFWQPHGSIPEKLTNGIAHPSTSPPLEADNPVDLLLELMKIDSTSGQEQEVAKALETWLMSRGWVVSHQIFGTDGRGNILATREPVAPESIKLILNTHYDTVPPQILPTVKDGVIYGRGSCDAKGVLAAMVFGAEKFVEAHPKSRSEIGLLFLSGEEVDHIGAKEAQKLGLKPKYFICGEPTENTKANVQKGILKVDLKFTGKAGHSGFPQVGKSANEAMIDTLSDIKSFQWPSSEEFGATTVNIGVVKGGVAANVIPPSSEATLAFRLITSPDEILNILKKIIADRAEMIVTSRSDPIKLDVFEKSYPVPFNTDLGYMNLPKSCKKCLVGPGQIFTAHGPDEFIRIADLEDAVNIYFDTIENLLFSR